MLEGLTNEGFKKTLEKVHRSSLRQFSRLDRKPIWQSILLGLEQTMEQATLSTPCGWQDRKNLYHL